MLHKIHIDHVESVSLNFVGWDNLTFNLLPPFTIQTGAKCPATTDAKTTQCLNAKPRGPATPLMLDGSYVESHSNTIAKSEGT